MNNTAQYKKTKGQIISEIVNNINYFFGTIQGIIFSTIIAIAPEAFALDAFFEQIFEGRGVSNTLVSAASVAIIYLVGSYVMAVNDRIGMSHLFTFIGGSIAMIGWVIYFAKSNTVDIVNFEAIKHAVTNNAYCWVMIAFAFINMIALFVLFSIIHDRNLHNVHDRVATEKIEANVYKIIREKRADAYKNHQLNTIEQPSNTNVTGSNTPKTQRNTNVTGSNRSRTQGNTTVTPSNRGLSDEQLKKLKTFMNN